MNKLIICVLFIILSRVDTISANYIERSTSISGTVESLHDGDSLKMVINDYGLDNVNFCQTRYAIVRDGKFDFQGCDVYYPQYVTITIVKSTRFPYIISNYLIEPGDNVFFKCKGESHDTISFYGEGSLKYQLRTNLNHIFNQRRKVSNLILEQYGYLDSVMKLQVELLEQNKGQIDNQVYFILLADIFFTIQTTKQSKIFFQQNMPKQDLLIANGNLHSSYTQSILKKLVANENVRYSLQLPKYFISQYELDSCLSVDKPFNMASCYFYYKQKLPFELSEVVNNYLMVVYKDRYPGLTLCAKDALVYFKNTKYKSYIKKKLLGRLKGEVVPNFSLRDTAGKLVNIYDLRGRILVVDFWYTGCGNCKMEAKHLSEVSKSFIEDSKVLFVTISIDKEIDKWKNSVKSGIYTHRNTLDLYTCGKGADHSIISYLDVVGYPTLMLIDAQGRLLENSIDPQLDGGANLITIIKSEEQSE